MLEKDSNRLVLLATEAPNGSGQLTPIRYANDLAVTKDGIIYFTDSTSISPAINAQGFYDTMASFILSFFQVRHPTMSVNFPLLQAQERPCGLCNRANVNSDQFQRLPRNEFKVW